MAYPLTLAACDTNPNNNGPLGTDLPATLDDAQRQAFAFIAQLRDGAGVPLGALFQLPTLSAPTGFVKLNGALLSRTTYANLFAFASSIGLVSEATWSAGSYGLFSVGDGSTTFRIPDLRGMHMRGLDESRGIDTGRSLGTFQDHQILSHNHVINIGDPTHAHSGGDYGHGHSGTTDAQGVHQHTYTNPNPNSSTTGGGGAFIVGTTGTAATSADGNHAHNLNVNTGYANIYINGNYTGITASSNNAGGAENRVKTIAYPFYMRY